MDAGSDAELDALSVPGGAKALDAERGAAPGTMVVTEIVKEDGRYLIYYSFEAEECPS